MTYTIEIDGMAPIELTRLTEVKAIDVVDLPPRKPRPATLRFIVQLEPFTKEELTERRAQGATS